MLKIGNPSKPLSKRRKSIKIKSLLNDTEEEFKNKMIDTNLVKEVNEKFYQVNYGEKIKIFC